MEYSAGLTSKLFWLQESRKTAGYILKGYSKADIRRIAYDVGMAKILNLIVILFSHRLFFEFLHEVYNEKTRFREKKITDRDLNVFFADRSGCF